MRVVKSKCKYKKEEENVEKINRKVKMLPTMADGGWRLAMTAKVTALE